MSLTGKVAVVTGGGTGIGKAVAARLGAEGARVAICGRRRGPLDEALADLAAKNIDAWADRCDVGDREQVEGFFEQVQRRWKRVDVLVNNAGGSGLTLVSRPDHATWDAIISSNLSGLYYCTAAAMKTMPEGGRVINVSSVLGKFGVAGYAAYCASKHGVVGFTKAVALELAPRRITVNAVCPGWVETDMARLGMEAGARSNDLSYEEFRRRALKQVPLGEMIEPEEVADLVAYLVGAAAANITGQSMNICGGQVMV